MLSFLDLLRMSIDGGGSDIFIVSGQPLSYKRGPLIITDRKSTRLNSSH